MKRAILALLALTSTTSLLYGQQPTAPFRSGVEAVYLDVTVTDASGVVLTDLKKDDFEIFDEDVQHDVAIFSNEPAPISVGVLVDTSGSMTGDRMMAATQAVSALGRSLALGDLWSTAAFSTRLSVLSDWKPFDAATAARIAKLSTGGSTALFKSVSDFAKRMARTPHRKRALLVITDGADDVVQMQRQQQRRGGDFGSIGAPSIIDYLPKAIDELRKGEVLVYGLGLDWAPGNNSLSELHLPSLQSLAEPTGGAVAVVNTVSAAEGAASRLTRELRAQYTLGFYPQKAPDGKYRRIIVKAKNPAYRVRTRAGYLAARPR